MAMSTTYQLNPIEVHTESVSGREDSICKILWNYVGVSFSEIDDPQLVSIYHGTTEVSSQDTSDEDYISFSEIDEDTVMGWVRSDIASSTAALHDQPEKPLEQYIREEIEIDFENQRNFKSGVPPYKLPWVLRAIEEENQPAPESEGE